MQRTSSIMRSGALLFWPFALAIAAGCSGGGASSPSPQPTPTLGGSGPTIALNQQVNFTVVVPPSTTAVAIANARRKRTAKLSTQATNNPYVSPNTASVTLQLSAVNGLSPKLLPAPVTVNITCPGTTGCSVPIQNVPAATGVDRFSVLTFASPGGVGSKLSASFIDVTVPSPQATSFGGTALTVGGFVASISLALNVPGNTFYWHAPSAGTVDVNALDASGAIIIGTDVLANPIQLSLPSTDAGAFTITGMQQLALQQPAQSLPLAYDGSILLAATVTASTTDENSQPFATSIPIPIGPPTLPPTPIPTLPPPSPSPAPTPTLAPGHTPPPPPPPTPTPPPRPQFSLYVSDAGADRIIEYGGINAVEAGQPLSATPRRIFEVVAPAPLATCPGAVNNFPSVTNIAISSTGTIYTQTTCTDTATMTLDDTFAYAASTQEVIPPAGQGSPAPPIPTSVFGVNLGGSGGANGSGIALDEPHNKIWLQYADTGFGGHIVGVQLSNPAVQTSNFGSACIQEYLEDAPCTTSSATGFIGSPFNFAVDANGFLYVPNLYGSTLSDFSTTYTPPGSSTEQFSGEPAITVFAPGTTGPAPSPFSVLAGFHDDLGFNTAVTDTIEGSTLYSLVNGASQVTVPGGGGASLYPGLSGCNDPPTSAAVPDSLAISSCVNMSGDVYLAGYANGTQALSAPGNQNTDVVVAPTFELGGDVVGGFGAGAGTPGDLLAVHDGFAYVLNPVPPSGSNVSEVDVYNLNGVTGFHTDIQPITRLVFDPTITPTSIAIGPTGTGLGGQALLRRPARAHHNVRAWAAHLRQLRRAQQQRRGILLRRRQ